MSQDDIKHSIHYDYKVVKTSTDQWVTVWYDENYRETYRSSASPSEKLVRETAAYLKGRYSRKPDAQPINLSRSKPDEQISFGRIQEAFFDYHPFQKPDDKWYIRWTNSKGVTSRISDIPYDSLFQAREQGKKIQAGALRKAKGLPITEKPYRKYADYKIIQDSLLYWIEWFDSKNVITARSPAGFASYSEALRQAANTVALGRETEHTVDYRDSGAGRYNPIHNRVFEPPKSWNEKWLEGISKWFPEGVPEELVELLK